MANHVNHHRSHQKKTDDRDSRARSDAGSGANGARGRTVWKRISARKERRSEAGTNLPPHNSNRKASQRPFIRPSLSDDE